MKLSIAWIFDHIKASVKEIDIPNLIAQFSSTTAEVEDVKHIKIKLNNLTLVSITEQKEKGVAAHSHELKKDILLPNRKDLKLNNLYFVKSEGRKYNWATMADLGSDKEDLMPAVWCDTDLIKGSWKDTFETEDYILTIDNKAFTHRPDMWGHRGFAREMAAILDKELLPEELFLVSKPIKHYTSLAPVSPTNPFTIKLDSAKECENACKRLATIYLPKIENVASLIQMAHRLVRIDSRPIDTIVDTSNYVMFDIGQPVHTFDAEKIPSHKIVGRCAHEGEKIELLDGETVTLISSDYVITDGEKPIGLAGTMGGKATAVSENTKSLIVESANFDAATIRKTATRIKKRTEASARFEKSLDPNQNTIALLRFLKILEESKISFQAADSIASIGPLNQEPIITLSHDFIINRIGAQVTPERVQSCLNKLGFGVQIEANGQTVYQITVPTFRSSKDVTIKEDIVEEIARFIGYDTINQKLPTRQMLPFDISKIQKTRSIKKHMAFALNMHEVQTYCFYDEEFLRLIKWEPTDFLKLANPFSENLQRLITSLVPNLLKCILINKHKQDTLNFFELNRVWFYETEIVERKELAGIFFENKKPVDFYHYKNLLQSLIDELKIDILWQKPSQPLQAWYNKHQTAELVHNGRIIGTAGMASKELLEQVSEGNAFIFEIDADFLLDFVPEIHNFKPLQKYQEVYLDISILVQRSKTVNQLENSIKSVDPRIKEVYLIDFFEKPEWEDKKSVTLRFLVYDETKTMVKEEIDAIWNSVATAIKKLGAQIR